MRINVKILAKILAGELCEPHFTVSAYKWLYFFFGGYINGYTYDTRYIQAVKTKFSHKKKHMEALIKFSFQIEYFTGQPSRQGFGVAGIYGMYSIPAVR